MGRLFCHPPPLGAAGASPKNPASIGDCLDGPRVVKRPPSRTMTRAPHPGTRRISPGGPVFFQGRQRGNDQAGSNTQSGHRGRPPWTEATDLTGANAGCPYRHTSRPASCDEPASKRRRAGAGGKTTTFRKSGDTGQARRERSRENGKAGGGRKRPAIPLPRDRLPRRGNAIAGKYSILSF